MSNRSGTTREETRRRNLLVAGVVLAVVVLGCFSASAGSVVWLFNSIFGSAGDEGAQAVAPTWSVDSSELTIAVSPVMAPVLQGLADRFNAESRQTPDSQPMTVRILALEPEEMVQSALGPPPFQAVSPDSSLWLDRLEQAWSARIEEVGVDSGIPLARSRTTEPQRYAVSPIVIAAWEETARALGWPERAVGWQDIQRLAQEDGEFRWSHPSTNTAAGLLATLAEFYAGAQLTRGLTVESATAPETLEYVQAVEATVALYGEGEEVVVQRLESAGPDFLDAFVAQERVVIDWNRRNPDRRLVALYPAEGTLWTDHPLALLELGAAGTEAAVTENQRLVYRAFADFLLSAEVQQELLQTGYRPADLSIALDSSGSPFSESDAVNWREPQTTLQMPGPDVVDVVVDSWYYTKRPTNVYLVVDTSGSMEGAKIERAREALAAFIEQIRGDRDRVGVVEFGSGSKTITPLRLMDENNRQDTLNVVGQMEAYGGTALVDAVYDAVVDLQALGDGSAINAVVVMTDGQENESRRSLNDLSRQLQTGGDLPIVVFTVGFGRDADEQMLEVMAGLGGGQYRRADETDIEELYRTISTYF